MIFENIFQNKGYLKMNLALLDFALGHWRLFIKEPYSFYIILELRFREDVCTVS